MSTQPLQPAITFGQLFKFFRIQAGFTTVAQFADALADHNIIYCESLYYHWQRNCKIPTSRKLLLQIISLFIDQGAIVTSDQANIFLESAEKGYLTKSELTQFPDLDINPSSEQIILFEKALQQFIELENNKKSQPEKDKKNIPKVIRFNCMLEEGTHSFLNKVARKNKTTKSSFIRQLINDYKSLYENNQSI